MSHHQGSPPRDRTHRAGTFCRSGQQSEAKWLHRIVFVVLLVVALTHGATEKIQLEDIERDNLISEQRAKVASEGLEAQQTQHLRPPGIQAPNSFHQVIGGVTYATGQPGPQATIEFVTLSPDYPAPQPQLPQVHEEDRTHSAPSRQSLLAPQQHTVQTTGQNRPQHVYAAQPQYIYVQAIPQAQKPVTPPPQYQPPTGQQQQEVESPNQNQAQQTQQLQFISIPQRDVQARGHAGQAPSFVNVPYNYGGGMIAAPSAPAFAYQPAQSYVIPTIQPQFHHHHHHQQSLISGPTPTPAAIQYAAPSTASPLFSSSGLGYVKPTPAHSYLAATQIPYASYQHSYPQAIEYPPPMATASTKLLPVSHQSDYSSHFQPSLDFFGQSSNHHSLLDSYIPSSYIYARTKAAFSPTNYHHRPAYPNYVQPSFHYRPSHTFDAHSAGSAYNTIAYSADNFHHIAPSFTAKRSAPPGA
ncbi:hypothetical protein DMENIID0001_043350 [Sergentomyia squamirostris]